MLPWDLWSILKLPNFTVPWWSGSAWNVSIKLIINVPTYLVFNISKLLTYVYHLLLIKTDKISMGDIIENSSTKEILDVP